MKVGDYVRFKTLSREIKIGKVIDIIQPDKDSMKKYCVYDLDNNEVTVDDYVIKSSPNIIDLIEVGDYVNGMEVTGIGGTRWDKNDLHCYCEHNGNENWKQVMIPAKDIKSIVTKENFSQMEYRIG